MVDFTLKQRFNSEELITPKDDNIEKIVIDRDERFDLIIDIFCIIPDEIELPDPNVIEKVLPDLAEIHCVSSKNPIYEFYLRKIVINSVTAKGLRELIYHGVASIFESSISSPAAGDEKFLIYWILNKYSRMGYTRTIQIYHEEKTKIICKDLFEDNYSNEKMKELPIHSGWHVIALKYKKYNFIYSSCINDDKQNVVPMSFIRFNEGDSPSKEDVNDIINVLSYLMGLELFLVGKTSFNSAKSPIKDEYYSTFRDDIEFILEKNGLPPVAISIDFRSTYDIESFINKVLDSYVENKDKIPLEKVFWYIKECYKQNIINTIQPLSTAYDLLCDTYLKNAITENLIDESEFDNFIISIKEEFNSITDSENKEILWNKIKGLNRISGNHRNVLIFDYLDMKISKLEKSAIKERNSVVHGSKKEIDIIKRQKLSLVFYTLINRIILRILDVEIPYIDYSNEKFTIRLPKQMQTGDI